MKKILILLSIVLISIAGLISYNRKDESKFHRLNGLYLGQKPPGMKAELFAPDLLSVFGDYANITFSADGMAFSSTIYTKANRYLVEPKGPFQKRFLMYSRLKNGHWTEPKEFSFTPARKAQYLFFSPDGKKIYFNSTRNKTNPPDKSSSYIWYAERQMGDWEWSEPKQIDFGEDYHDESGLGCIFPSVASNGNLYFFRCPDMHTGILYMSRYENGKYLLPEKLSGALHGIEGAHPYIQPDESYLIFDCGDLFVSFRDKNGKWIKPQNLGERVNTVYDERRPFVSYDGKYLFFASDRINPELPNEPISLKELQQLTNVYANGFHHIYWVDTKIIEDLKPDELK